MDTSSSIIYYTHNLGRSYLDSGKDKGPVQSGKNGEFCWYIRGKHKVYFREHDSNVHGFRNVEHKLRYYEPGYDDENNFTEDWTGNRPNAQKIEDQRQGEAEQQRLDADQQRKVDELVRLENWRELFHSKEELENAPPITFAIEGFLPERGITMLGGRSGDGKTLLAMNMARCLLEGSPLFGHFEAKRAKRVVYLIPESGMAPFAARTKLFHLLEHAGDRFFCRTLDSADPDAPLTDRAILKACEGADVFLDTAVRFMEGEENSASDNRQFARNLFALLRAGARTVTGLHHAPKQFERATYMSLENMLRGSGDIGAMLAACWGVAQIDHATTSIYLQSIKARDFEPCDAFIVSGRPSIAETGHFVMAAKPGLAGSYNQHKAPERGGRSGRPPMIDRHSQARQLWQAGQADRDIADALDVSERTVRRWRTADIIPDNVSG